MPQHDIILDNASGAAFRADANAALAALGSTMKGPNAPPAPIAGMMWLDDDTPSASVWTWKVYDGAEWLSVGFIDISANTFTPASAPSVLLAGAASAAAPAYSFAGDPDTGVFNGSANSLDFAVGGARAFQVSQSSVLIENNAGNASLSLYARLVDASAANFRFFSQSVLNESFVPLVSAVSLVNTDGSANWRIEVTPAGSRASDRRVQKVLVPGSGPVVVNSGGLDVNNDLRFNSGYGSAALAFGVRAWVNFNGTGTVAIRASGNVSSITDNGTGDYTVNFTTPMPDANYAYSHAYSNETNVEHTLGFLESITTTALRVRHYNPENSIQTADKSYVFITVVR